jgi:hypothetical protein
MTSWTTLDQLGTLFALVAVTAAVVFVVTFLRRVRSVGT